MQNVGVYAEVNTWHKYWAYGIGTAQLVTVVAATILYLLGARGHFTPIELKTISLINFGVMGLIGFATLLHTGKTTNKCEKCLLIIHFLICLTIFSLLNFRDNPLNQSPIGISVYLWIFTIGLVKMLVDDLKRNDAALAFV